MFKDEAPVTSEKAMGEIDVMEFEAAKFEMVKFLMAKLEFPAATAILPG